MTVQVQVGNRPVLEEVPFRREGIHVSLVVNRRQRTARLVDFLAGNFAVKQPALDTLAKREGIARMFTLVEKEESLGWAKAGYVREGAIPGYYKRSDAHVMGRVISDPPLVTEDGLPTTLTADLPAVERMLTQAKKLAPELSAPRGLKVEAFSDLQVSMLGIAPPRTKKTAAWIDERFGRTGERIHVVAKTPKTARGAEQILSAELQEPFGNAYIQSSHLATTADEGKVLLGGLLALHETLADRGVGCIFAITSAESAPTGAVFLAAGYRKTGALARHLTAGDRRVDAILWTLRTDGN